MLYSFAMIISGQTFSPETREQIQHLVDNTPSISRRSLSRKVCELLGWRNFAGRLKDMSCRKALSRLHQSGQLHLPDTKPVPELSRRTIVPELIRPPVSCTLAELGSVSLLLIENRLSDEAQTWNSLMVGHYLGARPFCAGVRYLVHSTVHGYLGGLSFGPAAWSVAARDQYIGWDESTRRANLSNVLSNSRFFIHPEVRVPHLASHVLGQAVHRVKDDWHRRYGIKPLLIETFVDNKRFTGVSYRAANWINIGITAGRGRQDRQRTAVVQPKAMYLYPLHKQWRAMLGGTVKAPEAPRDWAEQEWGAARLGDARLVARLLTLGRDRYARPQANIPQTCGSRAKTKAAYRFFEHKDTTLQNILAPHSAATIKRIAQEKKVVLAIQDTTSLDYSTHPATENLGPIASCPTGVIGLMLHATLAVSSGGTPLGLLAAQCWARDPATYGKKVLRHSLPIEEKESSKWLTSFTAATAAAAACPDTTIVSVGDREADIYELFAKAAHTPQAPFLLVRARHDRKLAQEQGQLFEQMNNCPEAGVQELLIPRKGAHPARTARLSIRYRQVVLATPKRQKGGEPLTIWAVLADEIEPPSEVDPLRWLLLTTAPTETIEDARERLSWYAQRWTIEVFHRTLKSGCKIENRQLGNADRLEACLGIDLVVAWRIHYLTKLGRETPDVPCSVYFEEAEWKALVTFVTKNPVPAAEPPTLREAIRMVAILGGFLARKSDGEPGTQTLWLGIQRLDDITAMWKVMSTLLAHPPPASHNSGPRRKHG